MNRSLKSPRRHRGLTLTELLTVVLVVGVLVGLASPAFSTFTKNKRISTQANQFVEALALARSEALKRVSRVVVCRSANGSSCAGSGGWEQGWIVFNDKDNDAQVDVSNDPAVNEPVIRLASALGYQATLRGAGNVAAYISYDSNGNTRLTTGGFQTGSLVLCDDRGVSAYSRTITVSITGRTQVQTGVADSCLL